MSGRYLASAATVFLMICTSACCGLPRPGAPHAAPSVLVYTQWPGAAAQDIEANLAVPLEAAVNGLAGVTSVRSTCFEGQHTMEVQFEESALEPLASVVGAVQGAQNTLPGDAWTPLVARGGAEGRRVARIAVTGDALLGELGGVATEIESALYRIGGVERVRVTGRTPRRVVVRVDPHRAAALGVDVDTVVRALSFSSLDAPSVIAGRGATPWEDLEQIVIQAADGMPVLLRDLAEMELGYAPREQVVSLDGQPVVLLDVIHTVEGETGQVAEAVAAEVARQAALVPPHMSARVLDEDGPQLRIEIRSPAAQEEWPRLLASIEGACQPVGCRQRLTIQGVDSDPSAAQVTMWWADEIPVGTRQLLMDEYLNPIPMISARVSEPGASTLQVVIKGDELETLNWVAADVASALSSVGGVRSVMARTPQQKPDVLVRLDREQMARFGLPSSTVTGAITAATLGAEAGLITVGDDQVPLIVQWGDVESDTVDALRNVTLTTPDGNSLVPLSAVADFELVAAPTVIHHINGQRSVTVDAELADGRTTTRRTAIETLEGIELPAGVSVDIAVY